MTTLESALAELNELLVKYPEKAREVFAARPELSVPVLGMLHNEELAAKVRAEDSPESFFAYCELMDGFEPPEHVKRQAYKVWENHEKGTGTVIQATRGFRKTTYWGVKFISYRVGKEPLKTHVSTGSNDDSATKVIDAVAVLIESHPEWKRVFPNIVMDKQRGWSSEGYYVKDTSVEYGEWTSKRGTIVDPTLVGGGYQSKRINGKHPSGVLYIDDLHDINNNSEAQRRAVVLALTTIILKTVIREDDKLQSWVVGVGVPWTEDDGYEVMKNMGYGYISTPAMRRVQEGEKGAVYLDGWSTVKEGMFFDDLVGWWTFEWKPFGVNSIYQERGAGKFEFWQMIMLDIHTARKGSLKYYSYPHGEIDETLPALGGCDPTTFEVDKLTKQGQNSHFALGYAVKLPRGGAVIVDGILEQCTDLQAENYILAAQARFSNWMATYIEDVSVGRVFRRMLERNRKIIAPLPSGLKGVMDGKIRNKHDRVKEISRWLEDATIRISDADTPYLNALRRLFDKFFDLDEKDYAFDAGDSLYHIIRNIPDVLNIKHVDDESFARGYRVRKPHPLAGISNHKGIGR